MEKKDKQLVWITGLLSVIAALGFHLDYSEIATSGLTLSSIVLAVYVAAIAGLINTELSKSMANEIDPNNQERTQLGTLTHYFKLATCCAVTSIIASSIFIFLPETLIIVLPTLSTEIDFIPFLSAFSLLIYAENILFLCFILKFMLNREIWNK